VKNKYREKNSKTTYILTKETFGTTLLLFSAIVLIMLLTRGAVFSGIGVAVCTFMYGTFGYGSLLLVLLTGYLGEWLVFGKKIKIPLKVALAVSLTALCAFLLFHAATTRNFALSSYGGYIKECYLNAANGYSGYTFGGVISALIVYPFARVTTFVGALVIFSLLTVASGYLLFVVFRRNRGYKSEGSVKVSAAVEEDVRESEPEHTIIRAGQEYVEPQPEVRYETKEPQPQKEQEDNNPYSQKNLGRKIVFKKGEFDAESYRRNMIFNENSYFNHPVHNKEDYLNSFTSAKKTVASQSYSESYQEDVLNQPAVSAPTNYVFGDKPVDNLDGFEQASGEAYSVPQQYNVPVEKTEEEYSRTIRSEDNYRLNEPAVKPEPEIKPEKPVEPVKREEPKPERTERLIERHDEEEDDKHSVQNDSIDLFKLFGTTNSPRSEKRIEPDISRLSSRRTERSNASLFDSDEDDDFKPFAKPATFDSLEKAERNDRKEIPEMRQPEPEKPVIKEKPAAKPAEEPKSEVKPKHVWKKYVRPGLELLSDYPEHNNVNTGEIEDNKRAITETLARFKIDCEVSNVIIGPAVTRYDVVIEDKTKITQSLKYKEAIAMALMKDNVTAYLNYSKGALSIEVPNNVRTVVGLKSLLVSPKFINSKSETITFALGKNVEGEVTCPDITKMPHLLVAGTTGSGKSICLSALIISLLYKYSPEELRLILVDPKQVEFIPYDKLPHLMINEIIHDADKSIKALNWAIKEMDRRYALIKEMSEHGKTSKNLDEYNANLPEGEEKLPKIVIILDEFGDLMLQAKKDIESKIIKLGQMARACGIHLILATQRPSVDCITGLIKSNLPTRIGFKVNSFNDSQTIFDVGGAEKLLGKGDLYFRSAESPDLARIQGCFISSGEVQRVTDFVKAHNETYFDQSVSDFINKVEVEESAEGNGGGDGGAEGGDAKIDETYIKALKYCITSNQASVSMIQRRFPVGYIKACKIIDWMENMNYVTHSEGSKPRKVLLSREEFLNTYGEIDD